MNDDLFGWTQFISSVSTTGALVVLAVQTYFIGKQVRQTQEQMDTKLRPWVGNVDGKSPYIWPNEQIVSVYLKNTIH
ncbi:MAG: hypothetical protein WCC17_01355 [Candidatus Nitrosopolaris sp.]